MVGVLSSNVMDEESKVCKEQNSNIPQARVSERLRLKKKRKELAVKAKAVESQARAIELTQVPIQHGNPAHKILFLTRLGLTPKSGVHLPPYLQLDRLSSDDMDVYRNSSESCTTSDDSREYDTSEVHSSGDSSGGSDIDDEDLDLELVISPIDIPEFFEEFFKKKPKKKRQQKRVSKTARLPAPRPLGVDHNSSKPKLSHLRPPPRIKSGSSASELASTKPLYREAFERVNGQPGKNYHSRSGLFKRQQVKHDASLDNIRQKLLHYNTVLEYVE